MKHSEMDPGPCSTYHILLIWKQLRHVHDTTNAFTALVRKLVTKYLGHEIRITHMHVVESLVNIRKLAVVSHILVDLDLTLQVFWRAIRTTRPSRVNVNNSTDLRRGQGSPSDL